MVTDQLDEIVNRHWHIVKAAYKFFGAAQPPTIRQTMKEEDRYNYFVQYSVEDRPVFEITLVMRGDNINIKIHNFVIELMEVLDVTAERK